MLRRRRGIPFVALLRSFPTLSLPTLVLLLLIFLLPRGGAEAGARAEEIPAPSPAPDPASGPAPGKEPSPTADEREALTAILEDGRGQVRQLAAGFAVLPDGTARRDLADRIREVKAETRLRFLEAKLDFARERGDLESVQTIEAILHPAPAPAPTPAPAQHKPVTEKGGAR